MNTSTLDPRPSTRPASAEVEVLAPVPERGAGLHSSDRDFWLGPVPVGCARDGLMEHLAHARLHVEHVRQGLLTVRDANAGRAAVALLQTINNLAAIAQCLVPDSPWEEGR